MSIHIFKNLNVFLKFDKLIGILVKTFISVVLGCYFNINIKMNKNGKCAYVKAS